MRGKKSKLHPKIPEIKKAVEGGLQGGEKEFKKLIERAVNTPSLSEQKKDQKN